MSILTIALSLIACGNSDDNSPGVPSTPDTPSNPTPPTSPDTGENHGGESDNGSNDTADTNWLPTGGAATIAADITRPFLQIIPNLPSNTLGGVSPGRELFITHWTPAGEGRVLFDGVGPLFNANACTQCHSAEGRKPVYAANGELNDAILFRLGNKQGLAHGYYGEQMQHQSITDSTGVKIATEGKMQYVNTAATDNTPAGIRFNFTPTDANQPLGDTAISGRISPQLVGMWLLNLIPAANIIAASDPDDSNNDGISGRVHWVNEGREQKIGRFGWKAINTSLRIQNANAMSQDMGLTTSVFMEPNCTVNQPICWTAANGGNPEVSDSSLDAVTDFMTALAVPERRTGDLQTFNKGANLFAQTGCASCHTPKQKTGDSIRFPLLSQQTIYPYTDLLLHDMGAGLDDGVKEKNAESFEWRTPPLWGIGIVARDAQARFLHDGRASTLTEAILWHGGEAEATKLRFKQLPSEKKETLLTFLQGI
ncbi:di-heme oxidoredictase family protein [Psychrobacter frigidicola]|uniref:di-heme oxidoredictase family protein n=1 Tax=Psychrobacter frigidicola TaxID=45611 RepID=UPI00191A878B|nr:di-heme oxidoredictase family protein [Psychrobacter frigidicola]